MGYGKDVFILNGKRKEEKKKRLDSLKLKKVKNITITKNEIPRIEWKDNNKKVNISKEYGLYEKKENVEYDAVIYIPSYDRYDFLYTILDDIFNQKTKYTYKVVVLNDGSKDIRYKTLKDYFPDIEYLENKFNGGIMLYWDTTNKILKKLKKYITNAYIEIDDDFKICNNFLDTLLDLFFEKKKENNKYFAIRYHIGTIKDLNDFNPNTFFDEKKRFQGTDGGTLFDSKFFEEINFEIPNVYDIHKNKGGSGVWNYFNKKITEMGVKVYTVRKSLANHMGHTDSKMHNRFKKRKFYTINFIDENE